MVYCKRLPQLLPLVLLFIVAALLPDGNEGLEIATELAEEWMCRKSGIYEHGSRVSRGWHMNTALLEELLRKKALRLQRQGLTVDEALNRAGDEIFNCMSVSGGHGSRFCLRMVLNGAKRRVSPEICSCPVSEGDKRHMTSRCIIF